MDKINQDNNRTDLSHKEIAGASIKKPSEDQEIDLKTPHVWMRLFILIASFAALILGAILIIQLSERSDMLDRANRPSYAAEKTANSVVEKIIDKSPETTQITLDANINDSFLSQTTDIKFALTNITELGAINDKTPVLAFLHVENNSPEKYFYVDNLSLSVADSDEIARPLLSADRAPLDDFLISFDLAPLYDIAPSSSASGWVFFLVSDTTNLSLDYFRPATSIEDEESEGRTILIDFTSKLTVTKV